MRIGMIPKLGRRQNKRCQTKPLALPTLVTPCPWHAWLWLGPRTILRRALFRTGFEKVNEKVQELMIAWVATMVKAVETVEALPSLVGRHRFAHIGLINL